MLGVICAAIRGTCAYASRFHYTTTHACAHTRARRARARACARTPKKPHCVWLIVFVAQGFYSFPVFRLFLDLADPSPGFARSASASDVREVSGFVRVGMGARFGGEQVRSVPRGEGSPIDTATGAACPPTEAAPLPASTPAADAIGVARSRCSEGSVRRDDAHPAGRIEDRWPSIDMSGSAWCTLPSRGRKHGSGARHTRRGEDKKLESAPQHVEGHRGLELNDRAVRTLPNSARRMRA